jgi:hypothetical protein
MSDFSEWLKRQIIEANSIDRLEFLADTIKSDLEDGFELEGIKDIRQAWARKKRELDERSH